MTHAGNLLTNPIFGENKSFSTLLSEKPASYFLLLHFIPEQMKTQASLENIVMIYLKVSSLSQSAGIHLGPRGGGVAGGTCCPLAAWSYELEPWLLSSHPPAFSKQKRPPWSSWEQLHGCSTFAALQGLEGSWAKFSALLLPSRKS
jgi:hypothetical protein